MRQFTKEHRRKLSEARKGIKLSEETKQRMSEARKGIKLSEETRNKMKITGSHRRLQHLIQVFSNHGVMAHLAAGPSLMLAVEVLFEIDVFEQQMPFRLAIAPDIAQQVHHHGSAVLARVT